MVLDVHLVPFHHQASTNSPCCTTSVLFRPLLIGPKEAVQPTKRPARLMRKHTTALSQDQCFGCAISAASGGTTILSAPNCKARKLSALQILPGYNDLFVNLYKMTPQIEARATDALLSKLHHFYSYARIRMITPPRGSVVVIVIEGTIHYQIDHKSAKIRQRASAMIRNKIKVLPSPTRARFAIVPTNPTICSCAMDVIYFFIVSASTLPCAVFLMRIGSVTSANHMTLMLARWLNWKHAMDLLSNNVGEWAMSWTV